MAGCLECSAPLTPSRRGNAKRFCCQEHAKVFENRARSRGAPLYHLFRVMRRERDEAKRLNVWTEMCRLELAWNDEDAGRKTWKPGEMTLTDLDARDVKPTTNIFVKEPA